MKSQTKDRIKLAIILLICIVIIGFPLYLIYGPKVTTGVLGSANVIKATDQEKVSVLEKEHSPYVIKIQEGNRYYLEVHGLGIPNNMVGKYTLAKEQYDKLQEYRLYWFNIKYSRPYDGTTGSVKEIYTYNPWQ